MKHLTLIVLFFIISVYASTFPARLLHNPNKQTPKCTNDEVPLAGRCFPRYLGCSCSIKYWYKLALLYMYRPCHSDEHRCGALNQCIPRYQVQDGNKDCFDFTGEPDGSDENSALAHCDNSTEFQCHNRSKVRCIPRSWVNNRERDCDDGSDENVPLLCKNETEYACAKSNQCLLRQNVKFFINGNGINHRQVYHNDYHCHQGDDESHTNFTCIAKLEFTCTGEYTRCIPRELVRDGKKDCQSGEDEDAKLSECYENEFGCLDRTRCLPLKYLCDGLPNCEDGSDEIDLCESPAIYSFSKKTQQFLSWSMVIFRMDRYPDPSSSKSLTQYEIISLIYPEFEVNLDLILGFKCYVGVLVDRLTYEISNNLRTVPQFYIKKEHSICYNKEDVCYDNSGEFRCAKCLDGTIISTSQICDGRIDCNDLSDECPCDDSLVKPLCDQLFALQPAFNVSIYNYSLICNGSLDEEYSINGTFCRDPILMFNSTFDDTPPVTEHKIFFCLNSNRSVAFCNGVFDCPSLEDECSSSCVMKMIKENFTETYVTGILKKCFPLLTVNHTREYFIEFSMYTKDGRRELCDENSFPCNRKVDYIRNIHLQYNTNQQVINAFVSEVYGRTLIRNYDSLDFLCDIKHVDCPWLHSCTSDNNKKLDIFKLCNQKNDCGDNSDERNCSPLTHFYCTNKDPLYIPRSQVNDGRSDCSDRSDECKETYFASVSEMLKSSFLRVFLWVCALTSLSCNGITICKLIRKVRSCSSKKSIPFYNSLLLINLACSDIIYGFTLLVVGVKSLQFSGNYCQYDLIWRSSMMCNIIGVSTLISSLTSMNILLVMTALRLYLTYWPLRSNNINPRFPVCACIMAWLLPIVLAVLPIADSNSFTDKLYIEKNLFVKDQIVPRQNIERYASKTEQIMANGDLRNETTLEQTSYIIGIFNDWYFNTKRGKSNFPNRHINIKGSFGFYSTSSICFPDLYTKESPAGEYSLAIVLYNCLCIILITIGYFLIFRRAGNSKKRVQTSGSANSARNKNMLKRIIYIVVTDIASWLPVIFMSVISYSRTSLPESVHPISAIIFLPINSMINPIIHSRIDIDVRQKSSEWFDSIRGRFPCRKGKKPVLSESAYVPEEIEMQDNPSNSK